MEKDLIDLLIENEMLTESQAEVLWEIDDAVSPQVREVAGRLKEALDASRGATISDILKAVSAVYVEVTMGILRDQSPPLAGASQEALNALVALQAHLMAQTYANRDANHIH